MKRLRWALALGAAVTVAFAPGATAATYFGIDSHAGAGSAGAQALANFQAALTGGTQFLETFSFLEDGVTPLPHTGPGPGGIGPVNYAFADFDLMGPAINSFNDGTAMHAGTAPISPDAWLIGHSAPGNDLELVFDFNIGHFGMWFTDFGDQSAGTLTFFDDAGNVIQVFDSPQIGSGQFMFFGFISNTANISRVVFESTTASSDGWGFDDAYYGTAVLPVPPAAGLGLLGMGLLPLIRRRKARR